MLLYRFITSFVGFLIYPYGRLRVLMGSELWRGRLGMLDGLGQKDIWIHASSVGEVKVAGTLIDSLLQRSPDLAIHLSVMTPAGESMARSLVGDVCSVSFMPLDADFLVMKVIRVLSPRVLVIAETEIWPNLIRRAAGFGIKVVLVNGRMSDRSFKQYRRFKNLLAFIMKQYDFCFFKSEDDLKRFRSLGLPEKRGATGGDMKFDSTIKPADQFSRRKIRSRFGLTDDDFLLVGGSTRPGERDDPSEEQMLALVYKKLRKEFPRLKLIIVPRHLQRIPAIVQRLEKAEISVKVIENERDQIKTEHGEVIVVSYMGGLVELYQAAELSFVGGTLVPLGGHNLLEPVWAGSPVVFGPHIDNIVEAAEFIADRNLGSVVVSVEALTEKVAAMIRGELRFASAEADLLTENATTRAREYILKRLSENG